MQRSDVEIIFEYEKEDILKDCIASLSPVAVLLGGQPSCGKTRLAKLVKNKYKGIDFLMVNGDDYRKYHPEHDILRNDIVNYSEKTQIFSNVFTEKLIDEAIKNRYSIIVEGTMRNPTVPMETAAKFKKVGFVVEACVIAAPSLITRIGVYNRYLNELKNKGYGRLSDMRSHDAAVTGLVKSVNSLYINKLADKISIHTFLANKKVKEFVLRRGQWNEMVMPGDIIIQTRKDQLNDKKLLKKSTDILSKMSKILPKTLLAYDQIAFDIRRLKEEIDLLNLNRGQSMSM
jgi:adenylate kinase family enzyme